ncbi:NUDIX domain-containing protein [Dactylosporangium salmoneum]|uniref:NUDIX domain-containing protein n=1 Tax=Dactylosporangium salmoneum TaxID=53361 RepID=UPI0031E131DF
MDVLLLYTRPGQHGVELLVGLRRGGYAPSKWDTSSGKLQLGERLEDRMAREAWEETGLRLPPHLLRVVAMTHWHPPDRVPRIGVFFHLEADPAAHGVPRIARVAELWRVKRRLPERCLAGARRADRRLRGRHRRAGRRDGRPATSASSVYSAAVAAATN